MGAKWKNPPIFYTVAQIRFNPVLSLRTYIEQIQEKFRLMGYPDFRRKSGFRLNLAQLMAGQSNDQPNKQLPAPESIEQYLFDNQERDSGFVLDQSMVSFQTTNYTTSDRFLGEISRGLQIVHEAVQLDYFERVGLRYLDAITLTEGEQIHQYVVPEVLGVSGRVDGADVKYSFSETVIALPDECRVTSRTIIQNGPIQLPPDLTVLELKLPERVTSYDNVHALVDTDAAIESRTNFDLNVVNDRLKILHAGARKVFDATYTEYAESKWN